MNRQKKITFSHPAAANYETEEMLNVRRLTCNVFFSGKEKDEETGYSYFGARYYNSDLSIWLSVDPLADKYPNSSPYIYCNNNPIMLVDPNGETPFWWDFRSRQSGWGHHAPQRFAGYGRLYDKHMGKFFDIQGTEFKMDGLTVRLWKGDYGKHRDKLPSFISGNVGGAGGRNRIIQSKQNSNSRRGGI